MSSKSPTRLQSVLAEDRGDSRGSRNSLSPAIFYISMRGMRPFPIEQDLSKRRLPMQLMKRVWKTPSPPNQQNSPIPTARSECLSFQWHRETNKQVLECSDTFQL